MAKPYDLFTRFLATQGLLSLEELNQRLAQCFMLPVSEAEFKQIEARVRVLPLSVQNQIVQKQYNKEFLRWMDRLGLGEIWKLETSSNSEWVKIQTILHDPKLKLTVNALLTKRIKHEEIVQSVNMKFSVGFTAHEVALYEKIFWDPKRMPREEWRAYLAGAREAEKATLLVALTESAEILKSYLELPSKVNTSEMLQHLVNMSFMKTKQYMRGSSPEHDKSAREWISTLLTVTDKYEKYRSGDVTDFAKELQLAFDYVDTSFDTPDEETLKEVTKRGKVDSNDSEKKTGGTND